MLHFLSPIDVTGPANISGRTITFLDGGIVGVTASQPGNENYLSAENVTRSFIVERPLAALSENVEVIVYPNPVVQQLFFRGSQIDQVQVFDHQGRVVKTSKVENGAMNVNDLASGTYILHIQAGLSWTKKHIVKN